MTYSSALFPVVSSTSIDHSRRLPKTCAAQLSATLQNKSNSDNSTSSSWRWRPAMATGAIELPSDLSIGDSAKQFIKNTIYTTLSILDWRIEECECQSLSADSLLQWKHNAQKTCRSASCNKRPQRGVRRGGGISGNRDKRANDVRITQQKDSMIVSRSRTCCHDRPTETELHQAALRVPSRIPYFAIHHRTAQHGLVRASVARDTNKDLLINFRL